LIYESRAKIMSIGKKIFCKENYKIIIIMKFILHQNIVSKLFLVDILLNIGHLLESYRLIHIMFIYLWKEADVLIGWGIKDT
jgi:hypothetical protein